MRDRDANTAVQPHLPALRNVGLSGVLISFSQQLTESANRAALAFRSAIDAAAISGVLETSTSLTSTFVRYDLCRISNQQLRDRLTHLLDQQDWLQAELPISRRLWRIPTAFGGVYGPQLEEAATLAGISPAQAIQMITADPVRVLTIGFAPGQPYLGVLPDAWDIPRQSVLTRKVPEGALVTAIRQLIVFTAATPTGWRHIGQTAFRGFRPENAAPFSFRPGDEVQFVEVTAAELDAIGRRDSSGDGGAEIVALQ